MSNRKLKKKIFELLAQADYKSTLAEISRLPERRVVNVLFTFFYHGDELVKWRAVSAMGAVVSTLARQDMESSRVVMRRLMWNLNDESGGIGWGSPEAMGEIMARSERLAREYVLILISYLNPDGNFLEHERLQRGLLWGVGRLSRKRPKLLRDAVELIIPFMTSRDPFHRGLSIWAAAPIDIRRIRSVLISLKDDGEKLTIYQNDCLEELRVGQLAREALSEPVG